MPQKLNAHCKRHESFLFSWKIGLWGEGLERMTSTWLGTSCSKIGQGYLWTTSSYFDSWKLNCIGTWSCIVLIWEGPIFSLPFFFVVYFDFFTREELGHPVIPGGNIVKYLVKRYFLVRCVVLRVVQVPHTFDEMWSGPIP